MTNKPWFQVLKGIGFILLLTLFWLLFFAAINQNPDPNNLDYEPFNGASFVLALPTYLIILFFIQYQKVVNLKAEIGSSFNAIAIKASHMENLVGQLREVTDRIVDHELKMSVKSTFSELIEEEKTSDQPTPLPQRDRCQLQSGYLCPAPGLLPPILWLPRTGLCLVTGEDWSSSLLSD